MNLYAKALIDHSSVRFPALSCNLIPRFPHQISPSSISLVTHAGHVLHVLGLSGPRPVATVNTACTDIV